MHCTEGETKRGVTLTEMMISLTIFSLLGAAIWTNVQMHGRSFMFNRASNHNAGQAANVVNRLVYGGGDFWGLRIASRASTTVGPTGLTGSGGQIGWQALVRHSVDTVDRPEVLEDPQQVITYDPVLETLDVDGRVVGEEITDSYFRIQSGEILLGVRVEAAPRGRGKVSLMETRIKMRNL